VLQLLIVPVTTTGAAKTPLPSYSAETLTEIKVSRTKRAKIHPEWPVAPEEV
jgi:hypothetical protein